MGNPFGFGSFVSRQFDENNNQIAGGYSNNNAAMEKQLFTNININLFIPKDITIIEEPKFNINEMLEDEIDKFDRI